MKNISELNELIYTKLDSEKIRVPLKNLDVKLDWKYR